MKNWSIAYNNSILVTKETVGGIDWWLRCCEGRLRRNFTTDSCRLCCGCISHYCRCHHLLHCTEVQVWEAHFFPSELSEGSECMVLCLVE